MNEMIKAAKIGGRGGAYSSMKARWTGDMVWAIKAAMVPKGLKRVRCEFEWVHADRRHDPDNREAGQKFFWDALSAPKDGKPGAGVIPNDGWDQNAGSSHSHRIGPKPGVWVTVVDASDDASRSLTPVAVPVAPRVEGNYRGKTKEGG
jgi:hypothetical protein